MNQDLLQELLDLAHAWDEAMVRNDAEAIGAFMADDWLIIGPDGSVGDRARFLELVASGDLMHDVMTTEDPIIRVYGDTAVVIAKGTSGGAYKGAPFRMRERATSVFVRTRGRWQCVATHLSTLSPA
jgi:ketosteroid isomerase-like protein